MSGNRERPVSIRDAEEADAQMVARLYRAVYPPPAGREVGAGYPFPQYMDGEWLAESFRDGRFCWLLATMNGVVVGCVGAAPDIGNAGTGDRIAELTGLVVSPDVRRGGIGQRLIAALKERLEASAQVMLAETRTGNLGGWRSVLKAGFRPIGFEPQAHFMSGVFESMVMMCHVSASALSQRIESQPRSELLRRLRDTCLRTLDVQLKAPPASPRRFSRELASNEEQWTPPGSLKVESYRSSPRETVSAFASIAPHSSGVIEHVRIRGADDAGTRFVERHYVAQTTGRVLAMASVFIDLRDLRARILTLKSPVEHMAPWLIRQVVDRLEADATLAGLATVVVDVRADALPLHRCLEEHGFFPTIYYPAFIAAPEGRVDAVQYTLLIGRSGERLSPSFQLTSDTMAIVRAVQSSMGTF